ncbi:hypothetical protein ATCC90586_010983 [Pythium insidiosum]|nr:hypothetical protein ATCC90586_010983 [Pythium insidiosum]
MVDKDLNEVRALQKHFPEARVLICHFHVLKYLNFMARKPEFGKCSRDDLVGIDTLVYRLVYATSTEQFDVERMALRGLCQRVGYSDFYTYMLKHWFNCIDMYVNNNYDEEMGIVLRFTNPWVAKQWKEHTFTSYERILCILMLSLYRQYILRQQSLESMHRHRLYIPSKQSMRNQIVQGNQSLRRNYGIEANDE